MNFKMASRYLRWVKILTLIATGLLAIWATVGVFSRLYEFRDDDPDRGAITVGLDKFGSRFSQTVYLDQGWSPSDSLWFYNTTQGSNLLPYSFFLVLEQPDSSALFRSDENIDRYGYLPQRPTCPLGWYVTNIRARRLWGLLVLLAIRPRSTTPVAEFVSTAVRLIRTWRAS